jgi:hypothetical protein
MHVQELLGIAFWAVALIAFLAAQALKRHWYQRRTKKHLFSREQLTDSTSLLPKLEQRRRSSRIAVSTRLVVSGVFPNDGSSFTANGMTIVVNKHGALIQTEARLRLGMQVVVIVTRTREFETARVVWSSPQFEGHYGIKLEVPRNIWGVYFPPADWQTVEVCDTVNLRRRN